MARGRRGDFVIDGERVPAGSRRSLLLPLPALSTFTSMALPVHVVHGRRDGPVLFVSAAIHGDEINGVEIIRRLIAHRALKNLAGTLILIPIVNVYGFVTHSRYLPDRRDLNRSFPGSPHGSLAARLAHAFVDKIVSKASHGIDLHTGGINRFNHPHIRARLADPETLALARAFGAPIVIDANLRDGSLRQYAADAGIRMLLFEAGEALRFDELAIRAGVAGVINVMVALGMISPRYRHRAAEPVIARRSQWVRAPQSGILRMFARVADPVEKGGVLGVIADPFGANAAEVRAPAKGLIVGRTQLPVVNEGDALFHVAELEDVEQAVSETEAFLTNLEGLGPGDYPLEPA